MNSFYTRNGDDGYTGILGKGRIPKEDPRLEAVGTIDEANAALGTARAVCRSENARTWLLQVQRDLYGAMSEAAAASENALRFRKLDADRVAWLESLIDTIQQTIQLPDEFIVPGDTLAGGLLDQARTVVRRAERRLAALYHLGELENAEMLRYFNRLSSFCFLLELLENQAGGKPDPTLAKTEPDA